MASAAPSISVVICAYAERRWVQLVSAVESVRRQSLPAAETIVVIDHAPALLARARAELGEDVLVVPNEREQGLGGARNMGVSVAGGSVVAFLDDDAEASTEWLERLAEQYADPAVMGAGGSIVPAWEGTAPAWFPAEFLWVVGCTYRGMPEDVSPVRNLIGCNMSYRRAVIDELGAFRLGYGCDETEFCIRARRRWPDRRLVYVPAASVRHSVPADRGRWPHFRSRCFFEGRSKAVVSWLQGRQDALASERRYTLVTIPRGIVREVATFGRTGDVDALRRAGAIAAGLAITTAGYASGRIGVHAAAHERGFVADSSPSTLTVADKP